MQRPRYSSKRIKQNPKKALIYAFMCSVLIGLQNFFVSIVSERYGPKGLYAQGFGVVFIWATYHISKYANHDHFNCVPEQGKGYAKIYPYLSKGNSAYFRIDKINSTYHKEIFLPKYKAWSVPLLRSITQALIQISISITYMMAAQINQNSGTISTIFSSSVLFTAAIFFCLYGQKLSKFDFLGCILIIGGVVMIGLGGKKPEDMSQDSVP